MARHRKIDVKLWGDEKFSSLSRPKPNAQTLWIFLLTGPQTTAAPGLFSSGVAALSEMLGWPTPAFRRCFEELVSAGMVKADWSSRVVWIPNAVTYNPAENPNAVKAWRRAIAEIPECALRDEAAAVLRAASGFPEVFELEAEEDKRGRLRFGSGKASEYPSGNDSKNGSRTGSGNQEQEQEQEQEQDEERGGAAPPPASPPALPRRPHPAALLETWNRERGTLAQAKGISSGRERKARQRLNEAPDLERWASAFRRAAASPFCRGENDRGWRASLDWFLAPDTLLKVEEGKYDAATPANPDAARRADDAERRRKRDLELQNQAREEARRIRAGLPMREEVPHA